MNLARICFLLALAVSFSVKSDEIAEAKKRWQESPHGPMLERLLPPTFEARELPQPRSEGARLVARYCIQCHNLPNPAMHSAARWPSVVERMVLRMQGRGNLGTLMADMMAGVQAPSDDEAGALLAYFRRNGQKALDRGRYPEVDQPEG